MCGEHHTCHAGSSPHVRGTRFPQLDNRRPRRFIPACAGNTTTPRQNNVLIPVHPRMCGEHTDLSAIARGHVGSSPHVRGTRQSKAHEKSIPRFIPACAGNTLSVGITTPAATVHPRMCGEHIKEAGEGAFMDGSSPHVRGTQGKVIRRMNEARFIPACAENTWAAMRALSASSVHPRMCGEHTITTMLTLEDVGSSPHVRGTL